MASRYYSLPHDQLVSLSEAYDKENPIYCAPDQYGVTAEECESYLKKLIKGERWSKRFIGSLIFPRTPAFLKRPFYPSTNKNVERLFDDFLTKEDILTLNISHSQAEQLDVICQSHPEVDACCKAVREELSHPSGDFIIGDLRFGMTDEELRQSAVYQGIERLNRLKSPRHKTNYPGLFASVFWSIVDGDIIYDTKDGHLSGIRIIGSYYPTYSFRSWHSDYDACKNRLNEIYGQSWQGWYVDGKKISLLSEDHFITIQMNKFEDDAASTPQIEEEQKNNPIENNVNTKKEEKEDEREEYYSGYVPGAHFDNWMNG